MSTLAIEPRRFPDTTSALSRATSSRATSLLLLLLIALLTVAPAMMRGRLFPRPTPYVATTQYAAERLRAREVPLWNPHEHLGQPVAQDGRSATWYPMMLLHVFLRQGHAWHIIAVLHLWLAGVGAWMLAGRYGLEPVPRLMCGAAYMLCGTTVLGLESAQANVVVWLPWAALAVERLGERVTAARILLASLVLTVQFLGSDLLASAVLVITCLLALLIRAVWIGPRRLLAAFLAFALALTIAIAASGMQWMPVVGPWRDNWLAAVSDARRAWPWGAGPFLLDAAAPALCGTIPLVLAAIAIGYGRRPRAVVLWTTIGFVLTAAVVAFEAWARMSGNDILRALPRPRVLVAGISLAVAILAGFGVETVIALAAERAARLRATLLLFAGAIVAMSIVVAGYFLKVRNPLESGDVILHVARLAVGAAMVCAAALVVRSQELPQWRSRGWAWVALACAELLAFAMPAMRGVALRDLGDVSDVAEYLRSQPARARFMASSDVLPAAFATWQRLADAGGAGRASARHDAWSAAVTAAGGRNGFDALRVANVRYLVDSPDAPPPPAPWRTAHRSEAQVVYEHPESFSRAWVAVEGRQVASTREALAALNANPPTDPRRMALFDAAAIDPRDRALIEERPDYWTRRGIGDAAGEVTYVAPSPEEVRVRVRRGGGGWLVVSDAFAPGWRATIHEQPEPLVAAFGVLRAVAIPAGSVEVVFRYEPVEWRRAILISEGGSVVMLLLLGWALLRPRGGQAEAAWRFK